MPVAENWVSSSITMPCRKLTGIWASPMHDPCGQMPAHFEQEWCSAVSGAIEVMPGFAQNPVEPVERFSDEPGSRGSHKAAVANLCAAAQLIFGSAFGSTKNYVHAPHGCRS